MTRELAFTFSYENRPNELWHFWEDGDISFSYCGVDNGFWGNWRVAQSEFQIRYKNYELWQTDPSEQVILVKYYEYLTDKLIMEE